MYLLLLFRTLCFEMSATEPAARTCSEAVLAWLARQQALRVCLLSSSILESQAHSVIAGFYLGAGNSNSGPLAHAPNALNPWVTSLAPQY